MPKNIDPIPEAVLASWNPPRPEHIPAFHARLRQWLVDPLALAITYNSIVEGGGTIIPTIPAASTTMDAAIFLHGEETDRLAAAQLFAIDTAMTTKARGAGALLPDWSVQPSDLPSEQGFLVFDSPIGHSEVTEGSSLPIVACSWGRSPHCEPPTGAVWLTFWSAPDKEQLVQEAINNGKSPAEARLYVEQTMPPLLWDDEALLCWSAGPPKLTTVTQFIPNDGVTGVVANERTLSWIQTVLATWLLVQDPSHVETTEQRAPRAERRRAERQGRVLPSVRVVSIHRRVRPTTNRPATPSGRTLGIRIPVTGFWRSQPYGKGQALRKRKWIDDHWRGPEDGPVQVRPRVTLVDEPPDQRR